MGAAQEHPGCSQARGYPGLKVIVLDTLPRCRICACLGDDFGLPLLAIGSLGGSLRGLAARLTLEFHNHVVDSRLSARLGKRAILGP